MEAFSRTEFTATTEIRFLSNTVGPASEKIECLARVVLPGDQRWCCLYVVDDHVPVTSLKRHSDPQRIVKA